METLKLLSWDPKRKAYDLLNLNYFGFLLTWSAIFLWIGIWAVIAFVFTDAGKHLILAFDSASNSSFTFTLIAIIIWVISFLVYHALFQNLGRVKGRLCTLCYHAIRWTYFVLVLLINDPLAWAFAFAFELVIVPLVVAIIFVLAWIHDCYAEIRKELNPS